MTLIIGVLIGVLVAQLAIFITTIYLHRGVTHGALTMHPVAAVPCRVIVWITSGIRPREWAGVHRRHHAAVDTAEDPHSPAILGFWRVLLTNVWLYRVAAKDKLRVAKYTCDIEPDRLDRYIFDRETIGPLLGTAILVVVFGWQIGLIAAATHAVVYVALNGAINAVGHTRGERPYPNSATNGRLLAFVTAGEGLHNNHHAGATSARLSFTRREIDPGWWGIRALCAAHLCEMRHPGGVTPGCAGAATESLAA